MTHEPTPHHGMYIGHWITCECSWSGPSRPTQQLASMTYEKHLRESA